MLVRACNLLSQTCSWREWEKPRNFSRYVRFQVWSFSWYTSTSDNDSNSEHPEYSYEQDFSNNSWGGLTIENKGINVEEFYVKRKRKHKYRNASENLYHQFQQNDEWLRCFINKRLRQKQTQGRINETGGKFTAAVLPALCVNLVSEQHPADGSNV